MKISSILIAIGSLIFVVVLVGVAVFFLVRRNAAITEVTTTVAVPGGDTAAESVSLVVIGSVSFPIPPSAIPDDETQMSMTPGDLAFVVPGQTANQTVAWYQTQLPVYGLTAQAAAEGGMVQTVTTSDGTTLQVNFYDIGDNQAGFSVSQQHSSITIDTPPTSTIESQLETVPQVEADTASAGASFDEVPITEVTAAPAITTPMAVTMPVTDGLALVTMVQPDTVYAGTLTRVSFTVSVVGEGEVNVTAYIPEGLLVEDTESVTFDPVKREATWSLFLTPGVPVALDMVAVSDLLTPVGPTEVKVVARPADEAQQPVIEVATLERVAY